MWNDGNDVSSDGNNIIHPINKRAVILDAVAKIRSEEGRIFLQVIMDLLYASE